MGAKLRVGLVAFVSTLACVFAFAAPAANAVDFFGGSCTGQAASSAGCSGNGQNNISGPNGVIIKAANIIAIIAGIAAVIMIMIGGIRLVTSGGDTGNVNTGRNMIIYALVGIVVIASARAIILFVINRAT